MNERYSGRTAEVEAVLDDLGQRARLALPEPPPAPTSGLEWTIRPAGNPDEASGSGDVHRIDLDQHATCTPRDTPRWRHPPRWLSTAAAVAAVLGLTAVTIALTRTDDRTPIAAGGTEEPAEDPAARAPGPGADDQPIDWVAPYPNALIPAPPIVEAADLTGLSFRDAIAAAGEAGHGIDITLWELEPGEKAGFVRNSEPNGGMRSGDGPLSLYSTSVVMANVPVASQSLDGLDETHAELVDLVRRHPDVFAGIEIQPMYPVFLAVRYGAEYQALADEIVVAAGFDDGVGMPGQLVINHCPATRADLEAAADQVVSEFGLSLDLGINPGTCELDMNGVPFETQRQILDRQDLLGMWLLSGIGTGSVDLVPVVSAWADEL